VSDFLRRSRPDSLRALVRIPVWASPIVAVRHGHPVCAAWARRSLVFILESPSRVSASVSSCRSKRWSDLFLPQAWSPLVAHAAYFVLGIGFQSSQIFFCGQGIWSPGHRLASAPLTSVVFPRFLLSFACCSSLLRGFLCRAQVRLGRVLFHSDRAARDPVPLFSIFHRRA
jgi:hypothetical protein